VTQEHSLVVLGRLASPHGLKGWLRIQSFTRPADQIFDYSVWLIEQPQGWREVEVAQGRPQGKGLIVKLVGCDDRTQAEAWRNLKIAIRREQLEPLPEDEFYWSDLIGLRVRSLDGVDFGVVDHLLETGANDVLVVKGDRERLIPFLMHDVIRRVDLESGDMEVDWDPEF